MIRSLGSSLLAKAGIGSLSRKKEEARITKPEIPGKGAVGTAGRDLTQETNITPVAPGSEKIIRSAPGIESASLPGMAAREVPLVAGVGLPTVPPVSAPGVPGNGMFPGAPASQPGQAGRQAQVSATAGAPMGAVAGARAMRSEEAVSRGAAPMSFQAPSAKETVGSFFPGVGSFGGRVSAEGDGNKTIAKNLGQAIVATLSPKGSAGEAWGTNPQVTKSGEGSVQSVLRGADKLAAPLVNALQEKGISGVLRSVIQSMNPASNIKKGFSQLRSKLGF